MTQMIQLLASKLEALGSIPRTTKQQQQKWIKSQMKLKI
jgi:hypothetical protein